MPGDILAMAVVQPVAGRLGEHYTVFGDNVDDDHGHGTHVAGTLGGTQYGVAKGVILHPVRVLKKLSGWVSNRKV